MSDKSIVSGKHTLVEDGTESYFPEFKASALAMSRSQSSSFAPGRTASPRLQYNSCGTLTLTRS